MSVAALFAPEVSDGALFVGLGSLRRLAHWWLRPEAIRRAGQEPIAPSADLRHGEFVILLCRTTESSVLERGLALPLQWRYTARADTRMPTALRAIAREVTANWRDRDATRSVSLWLGEDCPDLSMLQFTVESAGIMLAATLRAADRNFVLDQRVAASASFGAGVICPVDGLEAKQQIAAKLGIRKLLVARGQPRSPVSEATASEPEVCEIAVADLEMQIESVVLALDAPPLGGSLDARCDWYHRHVRNSGDRDRAGDFFCDSLAGELAAGALAALPEADPLRRSVRTLVCTATGSWEGAAFTARAMQPSRILVLHEVTENGARYAAQTRAALLRTGASWSVDCLPWQAARAANFDALVRSAAEQLQAAVGGEEGRTCVDLTGGTTLMKFALSQVASSMGLRCLITDSTDHAKGRTDVRTLRVIAIPHGAAG